MVFIQHHHPHTSGSPVHVRLSGCRNGTIVGGTLFKTGVMWASSRSSPHQDNSNASKSVWPLHHRSTVWCTGSKESKAAHPWTKAGLAATRGFWTVSSQCSSQFTAPFHCLKVQPRFSRELWFSCAALHPNSTSSVMKSLTVILVSLCILAGKDAVCVADAAAGSEPAPPDQ
jgi:hypothetical protein